MGTLSFREKSILGSLLGLVLVSGYYFSRVFPMLGSDGLVATGELARLGIGLLIALIVLEVIYQTVIAVWAADEAQERPDERDRLIAAWAGRNAGVVLVVCLCFLAGHILLNAHFGREALITPLVTAHAILLALVIYHIVDYASQLFAYRRGV